MFIVVALLALHPQGSTAATEHVAEDWSTAVEVLCLDCHRGDTPAGGFDMSAALVAPKEHEAMWSRAAFRVRSRSMPPDEPLETEDRALFISGLLEVLDVSEHDPGHATIRRLTRSQIGRVIEDLLGIRPPIERFLERDASGYGFDVTGDTLFVSPESFERWFDLVEVVLAELRTSEEHAGRLFDSERSVSDQLDAFMLRAWRRPTTEKELSARLALVAAERAAGASAFASYLEGVRATLLAPAFLYRIESDRLDAREPWPVDGFELAARLSFFLWGSVPDEELLVRATSGAFGGGAAGSPPDELTIEVERMLDDPRAVWLAEDFAVQWLGLDALRDVTPDVRRFKEFNGSLRRSMRDEAVAFFSDLITENRSVLECLDSEFVYVNRRLARHYGIEGIEHGDVRRVKKSSAVRGGVLGMAGVLTVTSEPLRTSPVKRGQWVLEKLLRSPAPPPPPDAGTLPEDDQQQDGLTLRERLERHRTDPTCASCHAHMDPYGFALEGFDSVGRTLSEDAVRDTTAVLPTGVSVEGVASLKRALLDDEERFVRAFTEHLFTYAIGRPPTLADERALQRIVVRAKGDGLRRADDRSWHRGVRALHPPVPREGLILRERTMKQAQPRSTTMPTLDRRTLLRGAGVALSLPMLESMARGMSPPPAPRRLACLFCPNGMLPAAWRPDETGEHYELSPTLAPIAPVRDSVLVLGNLYNRASRAGEGHYVKTTAWLSGAPVVRTGGRDLRVGTSIDQHIAAKIGRATPLESLVLGIEPVRNRVDMGYSTVYGAHVSWRTSTQPAARELSPRRTYERLVRWTGLRTGAGSGASRRRKVLDLVREEAKSLRAAASGRDRDKLDEYFEAVRSLEERIDAFDATAKGDRPLESREGLDDRPDDYQDHVRLMLDLVRLAFQSDATRVATFMFGNAVSGRNFSFLDGVEGGHHPLSHHEDRDDKKAQYALINRWHVAEFARFLAELDGAPDGDGSLLDSSMVLFGSGLADGNRHDPNDLPILLGGRVLRGGRHVRQKNLTPLCNLYVRIKNEMGVPEPSFGDSTESLSGV